MAMDPNRTEISIDRCILLICDIQEGYRNTMYEFKNVVENSLELIEFLRTWYVPLIITELQPELYGKTISQIDDVKKNYEFSKSLSKSQYSMCTEEIINEINEYAKNDSGLFNVILIGMETHVSVENTAIDLRNNNFEVHIVADCCTSRLLDDRLLAFQRMRDIGCHIDAMESLIIRLLSHSSISSSLKVKEIPCCSVSTGVFTTITHL